MRNSPLVEGSCAENVTGLKLAAEAVDVQVQGRRSNFWRAEPPEEPRFVGGNLAGKLKGVALDPLAIAWAW